MSPDTFFNETHFVFGNRKVPDVPPLVMGVVSNVTKKNSTSPDGGTRFCKIWLSPDITFGESGGPPHLPSHGTLSGDHKFLNVQRLGGFTRHCEIWMSPDIKFPMSSPPPSRHLMDRG